MDLITTLPGSMMEGFLPAGWDLAKIDQLAALPPEQAVARRPWWHPHFEPVACASFEDFDTFMGHEIAREIQTRPPGGPRHRLHPAGRPDGHVPLDRLLPQGMGRPLRPRPRLQHGRMVRRPGQHAAARPARRLPVRHGTGVLRTARQEHRAAEAAPFRPQGPAADLRRADRRLEETGRETGDGVRHRPGLPHRLLGAAFRRRVRRARPSGSGRRTASAPGCIR